MGLWMSLEGKVALITGTSSEIDRATEIKLAKNGAKIRRFVESYKLHFIFLIGVNFYYKKIFFIFLEGIFMKIDEINNLEQKAKLVREGILECIGINKKDHLGGSMSLADLVTALYFYKMKINPKNPNDPNAVVIK